MQICRHNICHLRSKRNKWLRGTNSLENEFLLKLANYGYSLFQPIYQTRWKIAKLHLICKQLEKTISLYYFCFIKCGNYIFYFQEHFSLMSPKLQYFAHFTSHIQSSKYDSAFGIKISICLEKNGKIQYFCWWANSEAMHDKVGINAALRCLISCHNKAKGVYRLQLQ